MEECELCGKKIEQAYVIEVEGVELRVCADCAVGKHIIQEPKLKKSKKAEKVAKKDNGSNDQIVENYGSIIREARERMKIPLKVLAEMINEKETLLLRIEEQKTLPSIELTKKLEKALNIKLSAKSQEDEQAHSSRRSEEASLGEFLK
ncbi:MAG: multiprotein bridging factor aMBF1, partial [Candidatus Micrarchaeia archaeon]